MAVWALSRHFIMTQMIYKCLFYKYRLNSMLWENDAMYYCIICIINMHHNLNIYFSIQFTYNKKQIIHWNLIIFNEFILINFLLPVLGHLNYSNQIIYHFIILISSDKVMWIIFLVTSSGFLTLCFLRIYLNSIYTMIVLWIHYFSFLTQVK